MAEELIKQLQSISEKREIHRFSPQDMVELLQDGEEVGWIISQVLPEGPAEAVKELSGLLTQIAAQVAAAGGQTEAPEPAAPREGAAQPEGEDATWQDLEQLPLPPGVDARQFRELMASPQGALLTDFSAFCQEQGMAQGGDAREMSGALQELHEVWLQTPRSSLEGKKPVEVLNGGRLMPARVETFRREAPKVGRNDPCPCGSGKKFKKCHGTE